MQANVWDEWMEGCMDYDLFCHLADTFIQSTLQFIHVIGEHLAHGCLQGIEPRTFLANHYTFLYWGLFMGQNN